MKKILLISPILMFCNVILFAQEFANFHDIRDNQTYRTVTVGSTVWMAENLNFVSENGSWCYDESNYNCDQFGRLYSFETAQNVCMNGWRLPTREEMDSLILFLNSNENTMLAISSGGSSGLNILPSGWRGVNENYYNIGEQTRFWTSTERIGLNAWFLSVDNASGNIKTDYDNKELGFSVRCIRKKL